MPTPKKPSPQSIGARSPQAPRPPVTPKPFGAHRPQLAQPKPAAPAQAKRLPVAPPAHRPQPAPKAAQPKLVVPSRGPAQHPAYRPEANKSVQPKAAAPQGPRTPATPQVYRPQPTLTVLQSKDSQTRGLARGQTQPAPPAPWRLKSPQRGVAAPTPAGVIQRKSSRGVIQLQVNTGIANKAALTAANWGGFLTASRLNTYMWHNKPRIKAGQGLAKDTYVLVWVNGVEFTDGTKGDLYVHMHEGVFDPDQLSGGGAWVDGGAFGHGQNIDGINRLKETCAAWINAEYESNCWV